MTLSDCNVVVKHEYFPAYASPTVHVLEGLSPLTVCFHDDSVAIPVLDNTDS